MDAWDPTHYARFRAERQQPFWDLLALVQPQPAMRVADLGCGSGELTLALHERLQAGDTVGIDSSAAMLAAAAAHARQGLRFEQGDAGLFRPAQPLDLVFSNAALHWVDDHGALFERLRDAVAPGGQLAVQMPANSGHLSHRVAAAVAAEAPFRGALGGWQRRDPVLPPEAYARLLHRLGFREQSVRLQIYSHLLPARDGVVEWVKGTLLTEYRSRLGDELFPAFLARYREKLLPLLEDERPYLYPYPRVLLWARK
jgi:trans-aconitate 2-methyltransferase